ncbi:Os06g0150950 [Oryza sativa Japonica Group]|uniref:Os06g0150950 protein n=1 Tax=Oryza sativa subsp. japonica TaxID=39947 RepID=A0A0P0WSX5_ORYSJ|nr:Os06g0150950 [Oryza sativa Japonica Group]
MHTRLSVVDHICFPPSPRPPSATSPSLAKLWPSTSKTSSKVSAAPRSSCSSILPPRKMVDSNGELTAAMPTSLYGLMHLEGRTLASIRWRFGYFKPNTFGDQ